MSWVRIHDGAFDHPKLVGLSDKAFRLWVWGLSYAQQHLTDGRLPLVAIPARLKRASADLTQGGLWDQSDGGYAIHDYLEWNESRAVVQQKRTEARERLAGARERRWGARRDTDRLMVHTTDRLSEHLSQPSENPSHRVSRGVGKDLVFSSEGVQGEPDTAERAGRFVERYGELYAELRRGAKHLRSKPALEWDKACQLVALWDDAHLEKLVRIFLTTDEPWIAGTGREFLVFAAKASWCDDRLREWEAKQQARA